MKPYIVSVRGLLVALFCLLALSGYSQKGSVAKGVAKTFIKRGTKDVAKDFNEAAIKRAFVYGEKEISENYLENAVAKQTVRAVARKKFFQEIKEKDLKSVLQYTLQKSSMQLQTIKFSPMKRVIHEEAGKVSYNDRVKRLRNYISRTATRIVVRERNQFVTQKQYKKWLSENAGEIMKIGVKDAGVLRGNMLMVMGEYGKYARQTLKNGNQAHHIIGNKTPIAAEMLKKYDIDINDPMNGIFLPSGSRSGLRGTIHKGGHTQDYYDYVEQMFSNCKSKVDCFEVLDKFKSDLYKGKIILYSKSKHQVNKTFK